MIDPLFWLGLSILLVAVSLAAVLVVAVPALQELGRAARSAEKLFDTLNRELPPTLEAIRLTGLEISDLTDDMSQGVQSAGQVVKQVDQSISGAKQQAQKAQVTSRSMMAGMKAAWRTLMRPTPGTKPRRAMGELPPENRLPPSVRTPIDFEDGTEGERSDNPTHYSSTSAAPLIDTNGTTESHSRPNRTFPVSERHVDREPPESLRRPMTGERRPLSSDREGV